MGTEGPRPDRLAQDGQQEDAVEEGDEGHEGKHLEEVHLDEVKLGEGEPDDGKAGGREATKQGGTGLFEGDGNTRGRGPSSDVGVGAAEVRAELNCHADGNC